MYFINIFTGSLDYFHGQGILGRECGLEGIGRPHGSHQGIAVGVIDKFFLIKNVKMFTFFCAVLPDWPIRPDFERNESQVWQISVDWRVEILDNSLADRTWARKEEKIGLETKDEKRPNDEFDTPWKEILRLYFKDFLAFFLPRAHDGIDWERGFELLDKELARITREAEIGDRRMDERVKVWQRDGIERWVLIHAEIQGDRKTTFSPDMYTYQYRAYDLKRMPVAGLAILADDESCWRPSEFGYELWGTQLTYKFVIVKLLDYPESELEKSGNPFAIVILAHLHAKRTKHLTEDRYQAKWRLIRGLYQSGFSRQQIIDLFRFIDWVLYLPDEADRRLWKEIVDFEESQKMPYISSVERFGMQIGMQIGMQKEGASMLTRLLQRRFGAVPDWASEKITKAELPSIEEWSLRIFDAQSLDDVFSDRV
ncbi:MAG: DUF4351 domain-containing protein [Magnetococcales bacterium]|nr:DUF4351 domain-containing protein [Magnetococcales bacterium]